MPQSKASLAKYGRLPPGVAAEFARREKIAAKDAREYRKVCGDLADFGVGELKLNISINRKLQAKCPTPDGAGFIANLERVLAYKIARGEN